LGVAYEGSGRKNDVIAAFQQAVKLAPNDARKQWGLGLAYEDSGRTNEAEAAFAEARKLEPELFK
jgi:Flp pilus assembly protein TadD